MTRAQSHIHPGHRHYSRAPLCWQESLLSEALTEDSGACGQQTDLESRSFVAGQRPLPFEPQSQRSSTQSSGGQASKVGTDIPGQKQGGPLTIRQPLFHTILSSKFAITFYQVVHTHSQKRQIVLQGLSQKKSSHPESSLCPISHFPGATASNCIRWFFHYLPLYL